MAREATATPGNFLGETSECAPPIAIAAIARPYVATSPRPDPFVGAAFLSAGVVVAGQVFRW